MVSVLPMSLRFSGACSTVRLAALHAPENFPTDFTDSLDMRQCSASKYCTLVTRSPGYGGSSGHAGKPEKLAKIR
jgi:hypothetical protein